MKNIIRHPLGFMGYKLISLLIIIIQLYFQEAIKSAVINVNKSMKYAAVSMLLINGFWCAAIFHILIQLGR